MLIVLAVLLAITVLLALAYPIVRQGVGSAAASVERSAEETLNELLAQREAAFQAIRDLHFDHEVGKITDDDLAVYETFLKQHAAETLRRLDAWENQADNSLAVALEKQVAARRRALSRDGQPCPSCGRPVAAGDQFCTACGTSLAAASRQALAQTSGPSCPHCGKPVGGDDRFCPRCGQPLAKLAASA